MKSLYAAAAFMFAAGSLAGAEALQPKGLSDFTGFFQKSSNIENGIRIDSQGRFVSFDSKKRIAVDLKKKYKISCEYRITPGAKSEAKFYFTPVCYDSKGRMITAASQNVLRGSDSVLTTAAKKGDKVIKVKDASKWNVKYANVVFNAKKDLSDLPNFDVHGIASVKKSGEVWEVTLRKALPGNYPAGTAVRVQRDGMTHRYLLAIKAPQAQWVKFSRVLTGAKAEGFPDYLSAWRPGTAQAALRIFSAGKGNLAMEIRNVSIVEVK